MWIYLFIFKWNKVAPCIPKLRCHLSTFHMLTCLKAHELQLNLTSWEGMIHVVSRKSNLMVLNNF